MLRTNFNHNLNLLHDEIILMGKMVANAIEKAVKALAEKDEKLAKEVYKGDVEVNKQEQKIESLALNLLLTEQPVASDFRFVTTTLKMITDLERIGDQASDIAYLILKLNHRTYEKEDLGSIVKMAQEAVKMLEDTLEAYINGDLDLINTVFTKDDIIDDYFAKVKKEVVADIKDDKFTTKNSLDLLLIAKYLERIGDHAENIAESVYFSITGENRKK